MTAYEFRTLQINHLAGNAMSLTPERECIDYGVVGEAFTLSCSSPVGSLAGAVVSEPAGSSVTWSTNSYTPTHAGDYHLTFANGTLPATSFLVRVFPAAALTHTLMVDPFPIAPHAAGGNGPSVYSGAQRTAGTVRTILRKIAQGAYGTVSAATFAALDAGHPIPSGLNLPKGTTCGNEG